MTRRLALLALAVLAPACSKPAEQSGAGDPSPSRKAAASAAPSASAAAPAKAWYEGAWKGSYQAALYRIEMPVGAAKAWKTDDGSTASGAGTLTLAAQPDGSVTGSASGALGEHALSGRFDGDRAALQLEPKEPGGFRGLILATQEADALKGTLSASTGDSLAVRQASVVLTRADK